MSGPVKDYTSKRSIWYTDLHSILKDQAKLSKIYLLAAIGVLFSTTIYWSILGAKVQESNADQLIYPLLFQHLKTLSHAPLPGQHTFLIKWPIFSLFGLIRPTTLWIDINTVILTVLVVGLFAYVLYRIEPRPVVFGTLCLALSSVLLMIPAEPYAGALLPANMAMLTTRNLEYILFILIVISIAKFKKLKSRETVFILVLMTLLFASDKLFMSITLAAALLGVVIYGIFKAWHLVTVSINWLLFALLSSVLAIGLLGVISASGVIKISNLITSTPYTFASNIHSILLGTAYGTLGSLTNLGANPATNFTILRNVPSQVYHGLIGFGGPIYIINGLIVLFSLYAIYKIAKKCLFLPKRQLRNYPIRYIVSLSLIFSSIVALALFIFSQHYYTVDSRYIFIIFFTAFVCLATYFRSRNFKYLKLMLVGLVIFIGIIFGIFRAYGIYSSEINALSPEINHEKLVAQILKHRPSSELIGNYWNVVPVSYYNPKVNVVPLTGCVQTGNISSSAWQHNLSTSSFTYLLSIGKGSTNFPTCNLDQIISLYGRPHQTSLISGTLEHPNELLLHYPHGKTLNLSPSKLKVPSTILPISLSTLQSITPTNCDGPTLINFVAHEDDDLLFMNPDLQNSINAGECVRTVYLTAGDSGNGPFFWLNRQDGSESAYSYMAGAPSDWVERLVKLNSHEYITVAAPYKNNRVSLIFMHLPDGNLKGEGFPATGFQSLAKLESGQIKAINTVDGQSYYSLTDLIGALSSLMNLYTPAEIRTQANLVSAKYPDHSDHISVGNVVRSAYVKYDEQQYGGQVSIPIHYYVGYPIHGMPANVSDGALNKKEQTFFIYSQHDPTVCQSIQLCTNKSDYGIYLPRQYQHGS